MAEQKDVRTRVTRRRVLQAGAAAIAAPYFVPSAAMGGGGWNAPSERVTVGFIGVGNMGSAHLGAFLGDKQTQLVAMCDVDGVKKRQAAEKVEMFYAADRQAGKFKGCTQYHEYEELLAREDIDAVLIAVPDHWHAMISIAACRAGKDVYCEKPLSLTIREADQMVAAARRYGRVFQTGSQQRSEWNFRKGCELVQSGYIGELKEVYVNVGGPSQERFFPEEPVRPEFDWDRWLGPAPWQPYNSERCSGNYGGGWRQVRDYSGGMMTDWGAHHFDIAQWGIGADGSGPVAINPPDGKDYTNLTYTYANGVQLIHSNKTKDGQGVNGALFVGTEGKVEVNRGHFKTWPDELAKVELKPNDVHLYDSPHHRTDWLNCIRSRSRPICDVGVGASSVTVCHLGNIAYWLNRPLKWDPVKRELIGDPEASRWLDRPKRAPWRIV